MTSPLKESYHCHYNQRAFVIARVHLIDHSRLFMVFVARNDVLMMDRERVVLLLII